jgi:adenylate cyclase
MRRAPSKRSKGYRRDLIDPKIAQHRGRVVNTAGDGFLVEFGSAVDAVRCAIEIQRAMAERNLGAPGGGRTISPGTRKG